MSGGSTVSGMWSAVVASWLPTAYSVSHPQWTPRPLFQAALADEVASVSTRLAILVAISLLIPCSPVP
jgi:hypothetical protein